MAASNPVESTDWKKWSPMFAQRNASRNATHILPYLKPTSRILDIGCGIGTITLDLAQRCPQGHITGIDVSEDSIAKARKAAMDMGITNVDFFVHNAEEPFPLTSSSFDIAHAHQVVGHLHRPVLALSHIIPLLKPSGILAIRDCAMLTTYPSTPTIEENFVRFTQNSGGSAPKGGLKHHVWLHEAGFSWANIQYGLEGYGSTTEAARRVVASGWIGFAEQRSESEEFMKQLRGDWEMLVKCPEGRTFLLDSWCIGTRGE